VSSAGCCWRERPRQLAAASMAGLHRTALFFERDLLNREDFRFVKPTCV
jgi:hypothetical protein